MSLSDRGSEALPISAKMRRMGARCGCADRTGAARGLPDRAQVGRGNPRKRRGRRRRPSRTPGRSRDRRRRGAPRPADSAWQQALTEAGKSNGGDIRKEGVLLKPRAALARPAPTPGSYNCRLIKLGKATPEGAPYRKLQALLLLRRGRGRPADHRQADRQPAPGGPACGTMTMPTG